MNNGTDPKDKSEGTDNREPDQKQSADSPDDRPTDARTDFDAENSQFMRAAHKFTSSAEKIIGTVYTKSRTALKKARFDPLSGIRALDGLLNRFRGILPPEKYDSIAGWFAKSGHTALVAAQILALLFTLIAAFKMSRWVVFVGGIGITLALLILQYTADKLMNAGNLLVRSSPSRLRSSAFLNCLALVTEVTGIMLFVGMLVQASLHNKWIFTFVGLGLWAFCDAIFYIALNPSMANVTIDENVTAGEEAIGIMSFFVKAVVRTVPLVFGVGTIVGSIALFLATYSVLRNGNAVPGYIALKFIAVSACLPFIAYVVFAFYHLLLDILRAILILPDKLDKVGSKGQPADSLETQETVK
jgi:hypothetical protein